MQWKYRLVLHGKAEKTSLKINSGLISFPIIIISILKRIMQRQSLSVLYQRALENVKKNHFNIEDLSETQFKTNYANDPFFQARVDVQLEKAKNKIQATTIVADHKKNNEFQTCETLTLRKKNSREQSIYAEKCKQYVELIAACR